MNVSIGKVLGLTVVCILAVGQLAYRNIAIFQICLSLLQHMEEDSPFLSFYTPENEAQQVMCIEFHRELHNSDKSTGFKV